VNAGDSLRSAAGWKLTLSPQPPGGSVDALGAAAKLASALLPVPTGDDIVLSHAQYRAEISVNKAVGLDGGRVRVTIQRVPFRMLEMILSAYEKAAKRSGDGPLGEYYGKLELLWRIPAPYPALDAAVDLIQDLAGAEQGDLAASFVVTGLTTEVDKVNYRLVIEGVDAAWYRLATQRVDRAAPLANADDVRSLCKALGVQCGAGDGGGGALAALSALAGLGGGGAAGGTQGQAVGAQVTPRERPLDRLGAVQTAIAEKAESEWLGGFLFDNGRLLVGKDVRDAFDAEPIELGADVISANIHRRDPTEAGAREEGATLTVRGNAKLKPGRVVRFNSPRQSDKPGGTGLGYADAVIGLVTDPLSLAGKGSGKPSCLYIRSVGHRQGPSSGFVTELEGVVVGGTKPTLPKSARAPATVPLSSSPHAIAGAIDAVIREAVRSPIEIGEVRQFRATGGGPDAPGQTSDVIAGLSAGKGDVQPVRTLDVQREKPHRARAVPYVTPFAWGKYGLVLPRYPGMRLALAEPQAKLEQAVDLGALWWSGEDNNTNAGPASAEAGDYWLILPVDPKNSTVADEPATAVQADAKAASHDLTDAKGRRFLQLRELTIRVGEWTLKAPDKRPGESSAAGGLRIEGKDGGAFIQIDKDGNISIGTPKKLTLKADEGIAIESNGGVSLKSAGVEALVKNGKVDVS